MKIKARKWLGHNNLVLTTSAAFQWHQLCTSARTRHFSAWAHPSPPTWQTVPALHPPSHLLLNELLCPVPQGLPPGHLPALSWRVCSSPWKWTGMFVCLHFFAGNSLLWNGLLPQEKARCLLYRHKGGSTTALLTVYVTFLAGEIGQGQKEHLEVDKQLHQWTSTGPTSTLILWVHYREHRSRQSKSKNSDGGDPWGIRGQ